MAANLDIEKLQDIVIFSRKWILIPSSILFNSDEWKDACWDAANKLFYFAERAVIPDFLGGRSMDPLMDYNLSTIQFSRMKELLKDIPRNCASIEKDLTLFLDSALKTLDSTRLFSNNHRADNGNIHQLEFWYETNEKIKELRKQLSIFKCNLSK